MKRDSWGGPNIMVWSGIGINFKLGPFRSSAQAENNRVAPLATST